MEENRKSESNSGQREEKITMNKMNKILTMTDQITLNPVFNLTENSCIFFKIIIKMIKSRGGEKKDLSLSRNAL